MLGVNDSNVLKIKVKMYIPTSTWSHESLHKASTQLLGKTNDVSIICVLKCITVI